MKLKTVPRCLSLLRVTVAAIIALATPVTVSFMVAAPAKAGVSIGISINFGSFYDRLAPYGDWVQYGGRTVWVPTRRAAHWRPYERGHWVYTDRYGWLWVSAEPFGWATYHYGRWGYSPEIGWYWVPGYRWAPAWVSWRRSNNYVGWAPLPIGYPDNGGVSITIAPVPDFYWQVVPSRSFLSVNLAGVIIRDRHRIDPFFRHARPIGRVRMVNNIVVNNVFGVSVVEGWTHKKVRTYRVRQGHKPGMHTQRKGGFIEVYAPQVSKGGQHKPKRLKSLNEVKAWHKKHGEKMPVQQSEQKNKQKQQLEQKNTQKQQLEKKAKQKQLQQEKAKQRQLQQQKARQQRLQQQKATQQRLQQQKATQQRLQEQKARQKQLREQKAREKKKKKQQDQQQTQ